MSRFAIGFRTTGTSAGAVIEFIGPSTPGRLKLIEFGITPVTQVVTSVGLGYAAIQGITPTTPVTLLSEDDTATTTATCALAWGTAPTAPTGGYYFRRASIPLTQQGLSWSWSSQKGLLLVPSTSICLYLLATGPQLDGWAVFEQ